MGSTHASSSLLLDSPDAAESIRDPARSRRDASPPPIWRTGRHRARRAGRLAPGAPAPEKQILFGDLHVHTTFSADAFMRSLPMLQGEGAHPPADACDFARFCSALDFWSINDHAEAISPQHWQETKESIRQCNAVAGDPKNPDVVAFLGWEWTQVGRDARRTTTATRTSSSATPTTTRCRRGRSARSTRSWSARCASRPPLWQRLQFPLLDCVEPPALLRLRRVPAASCATRRSVPSGVDTRQLPADCHESAQTPRGAVREARRSGASTRIVIPHGTTWGLYTPPGIDAGTSSSPRRSTIPTEADADRGLLRPRQLRGVPRLAGRSTCDADGNADLPGADRRLPAVLLAGRRDHPRALRRRAGRRVRAARRRRRAATTSHAGVAGRLTVPGRDGRGLEGLRPVPRLLQPGVQLPARRARRSTRSRSRNFDDPADPRRFRFGFIASSDNHSARPGTGYKEYGRRMMTEATGAARRGLARSVCSARPDSPTAESVPFDPDDAPTACRPSRSSTSSARRRSS